MDATLDTQAADRLDDLARQYLSGSATAPTRYIRTPPLDRSERWRGTGVAFRRRADGLLAAACLGVTGVGMTEGEALRDLERRLQVAPAGWPMSPLV